MEKKYNNNILTVFLIFFLFYSIVDIWLAFNTGLYFLDTNSIKLLIDLLQILSIVFIFIGKRSGFYGFYLVRALNIIFSTFTSVVIWNSIIEIMHNLIIAIVFLIISDRKYMKKMC